MRKRIPKILVTGGAGFIGSALVRLLIKNGFKPIVMDKLTYAGDLRRLADVKGAFKFYKTDICDKKQVESVFQKVKPDIVVHLAAESHVDRSIIDASAFIETNVKGTQILMDASRASDIKKFIYISTDEVYGEIARGKFCEDSAIKPSSPYAASKAAADLLVQSYIRTSKFPAIIIRPSNNYGPWQYPEKLISLSILRIFDGSNIPVYGRGLNWREWLYVDDCAEGIFKVLKQGKVGQIYNLGSSRESKNIDTVRLLLKILKVKPDRYEFVKDRPGHDLRYCLDSKKLCRQIGWRPKISLSQGLKLTVEWSNRNRNWLKSKLGQINALYK